jgi:hypothetical protein
MMRGHAASHKSDAETRFLRQSIGMRPKNVRSGLKNSRRASNCRRLAALS